MKTAIENAQQTNPQQSESLLAYMQKIIEEHQKIDEQEHQDAEELLKNI